MIKALLFDLDGVIVDTAVYHYKAWKKMANGLGFDIDEQFNEKLKGISRMDSIALILEHGGISLSPDEVQSLANAKNDHYVGMINQMTPDEILPGILTLIGQLKENNIKIALGSASKNAPIILEKVGLLSAFDAIVDGNSVSKSKPDPEVFLKGAIALGLANNECVVVEDAYAGIQAAHAAGMKAIGIGSNIHLPNADIVIESFENRNILDLLKEMGETV